MWILVLVGIAGLIFVWKMGYVLSTALVLPATGGALYVSTSKKRIAAFLEAVPLKPGDRLVDLGCGDGRVLRAVKKRYKKVRAIGYELNPLACLQARLLSLGHGTDIRRENFWKADLSHATVVFCYLFPDVMKPLSAKLQAELKPGTVVVSCNFPLPDILSDQVIRPRGSLHSDPIYIYRIKEPRP
jgi:trans-aconitate methyltransferase